jgi:glycosyltransferase involved in cell wall biosynthesis
MKQTLIFEATNGGHRQEFIEHLMDYIMGNHLFKDRFVFLLNKDLVHNLSTPKNSLQIEEIEPNTTIKQHEQSIIQTLNKHPNIDTVLFMNMDSYLTTIIKLGFKKFNIKIKGILFQPFHQFPKQTFDFKSLRFRKKNHLLATLCLNWRIKQIFVLNDEKGVKKLNNWSFINFWKKVFTYLPDPIDGRNKINAIDKAALLSQYAIEKDRHILLSLGAIDERKNVLASIKAVARLANDTQKKICLFIVGKNYLADIEALPNLIKTTLKNCPDLQIIWISEFVSDEQREQLFMLSDIVLMPYLNFYASSGILGHAIKYGKPVIGANVGVTSDIIAKYQLGTLVNPAEIGSITEGVETTLKGLSNTTVNPQIQRFLAEHTPALFAERLLNPTKTTHAPTT